MPDAILGVLAWRAVTFLLPIPVGGISYLLLQRPHRRTRLSPIPDPHPTEETHEPDIQP